MTLVDKHALTAALAERDAARAEVARLQETSALAWDRGFTAGYSDGIKRAPNPPTTSNPYPALAATEDQP